MLRTVATVWEDPDGLAASVAPTLQRYLTGEVATA
jgi:hypothetical protein